MAEHVHVVSVDEGEYALERAEIESLVGWLASHDVEATHDVLPLKGTVAEVVASTAALRECDLIVCGGYGRTRLSEWLFGGVTRDLLEARYLSRLMSN
jgi:nucleotide-binding universal stress UspA family protein